MKKIWMSAMLVVSFGAMQAWSEETAAVAATNVPPPPANVATPPPPAKKAAVPLETLTLTGKLVKEEATRKAKNGTESKVTVYLLKMEDGTSVTVHPFKPAKGQVAINYDNYVDKQIQVVGTGIRSEKNGKKTIHLRTVASMAEAAAAPATDAAVAPAVPAATPAAATPAPAAPAEEKK